MTCRGRVGIMAHGTGACSRLYVGGNVFLFAGQCLLTLSCAARALVTLRVTAQPEALKAAQGTGQGTQMHPVFIWRWS